MGLSTLLGKFFGGGDKSPAAAEAAPSIDYNGFTITAAPIKEGGQFRTAGTIAKEIDGTLQSVQFIRADNHSDRDGAVSHSERKGQQIVDEQGDGIFDRNHI